MTHAEYLLCHRDRMELESSTIQSIILVELAPLKKTDRKTYDELKEALNLRQRNLKIKLERLDKVEKPPELISKSLYFNVEYPNLTQSELKGIENDTQRDFARGTDGRIDRKKLVAETHRRLKAQNDKGGE